MIVILAAVFIGISVYVIAMKKRTKLLDAKEKNRKFELEDMLKRREMNKRTERLDPNKTEKGIKDPEEKKGMEHLAPRRIKGRLDSYAQYKSHAHTKTCKHAP